MLRVPADDGSNLSMSFDRTLCVVGGPRLISVPRLIDGGAAFSVSSPEEAVLTVGGKKITAPRHNGLYALRAEAVFPGEGASASSSRQQEDHRSDQVLSAGTRKGQKKLQKMPLSARELHSMMKHNSLTVMKQAARNGELDWVPPKVLAELRTLKTLGCEFCPSGKLTRRAHRQSDTVSEELRFHSDTFGPCPASFGSKCKHAVIYIHQPTNFWFLFGLTSCSCDKVLSAFKTSYYVALQYGHVVRALLSDNGTEYTAEAFKQFMDQEGLLVQFSAPGRQDQNGKSERSWRTLSEAASDSARRIRIGEVILAVCILLHSVLEEQRGCTDTLPTILSV
jgi:hypothetical protein